MYFTDEEAKKIWCPDARTSTHSPSYPEVETAVNRWDNELSFEENGIHCLGSKCGKHRWADDKQEKGYCGAAGHPHPLIEVSSNDKIAQDILNGIKNYVCKVCRTTGVMPEDCEDTDCDDHKVNQPTEPPLFMHTDGEQFTYDGMDPEDCKDCIEKDKTPPDCIHDKCEHHTCFKKQKQQELHDKAREEKNEAHKDRKQPGERGGRDR